MLQRELQWYQIDYCYNRLFTVPIIIVTIFSVVQMLQIGSVAVRAIHNLIRSHSATQTLVYEILRVIQLPKRLLDWPSRST
jgi:hypothetical protein